MCVFFGNPKRIRLDSEESWMSEVAASFFGRESVSLEPIPGHAHWQTCTVEEAIRRLKATMAQLPAPTQEKMSGSTLHYNTTRWEEHQIWTAGSTHQNTRHSIRYKRNLWMRHTATTSSGCTTRRSTSFAGRTGNVFPEP